jgi:MFS family permease
MQVGFTRLYGTSDARMFTAFAVAASTLLGVDTVLLVVFADRRLGDGTSGYGLLLAAIGVGGLVGVLVVDRISATRRPGRALVRGLVCCALPTVALVPVHSAPPAFAIEVVSGIGSMATATLASVGFQRSMPPRTLSGAIAAFHTVLLLGLVLGAAVTPLLLNRGGLDAALVVVGLAFPTVGVACTPLLRRLDTDSAVILDGLAPRVTVLEGLAVLEHARHPTLERLASAAAIVRLDAGLVVIAEGDPADAFYALVDGDVEVTKAEGAADRVVARLSGPDYFGEIGLLRRIPRTATVSTITACTVLRIAGADFLAALAEGSPSAMLVDTVVTRLGQLTHDDRSGSG